MQSTIQDRRPDYIGKRQVVRLCSDAYGKGIVRSNQESINLRIGGIDANVTFPLAVPFITGGAVLDPLKVSYLAYAAAGIGMVRNSWIKAGEHIW